MKAFKDLIELLNWISLELEETSLFEDTITFEGDISSAKTSSAGDLYIEVSERNVKGKTYKMTVFLSRYYIKTLLERLNLNSVKELENKSWKFFGKISFWPSSSSIAIRLQSLQPLGKSKLEKRRREILNKLKAEGLLRTKENKLEDLNPIRKIAVISSETAAGYGDFVKNINKLKIPPVLHLYPSSMQGIEVPVSVSKALKLIIDSKIDYDVIVIIRGGGAQSDLMYFDDYRLAQNIAWVSNNKIPILTGIGHEQDATIPDFVSYMRFSTPTEVARAIVKQIETFNNLIDNIFYEIIYNVNSKFLYADMFAENVMNNMNLLIDNFFEKENNIINNYMNSFENINNVINASNVFLSKEFKILQIVSQFIDNKIEKENKMQLTYEKEIKTHFNIYENNLSNLIDNYYIEITKNSPFSSFLSRGAILVQNSQIIDSVYDLDKKEELDIKLKDGEVKSKIKNIIYFKEEDK